MGQIAPLFWFPTHKVRILKPHPCGTIAAYIIEDKNFLEEVYHEPT
jgi:hypothetical protein